ncbi:hypothetical protein D3C86_2011160 [compost metagenome]
MKPRPSAEPLVKAIARPVKNSCVPSVAMIGVKPALEIRNPFSIPPTRPTSSAMPAKLQLNSSGASSGETVSRSTR